MPITIPNSPYHSYVSKRFMAHFDRIGLHYTVWWLTQIHIEVNQAHEELALSVLRSIYDETRSLNPPYDQ